MMPHTLPIGWSIQPWEDEELSWSDKARQSGDIRAPKAVESGGRVLTKSKRPFDERRPAPTVNPLWRGRVLSQCWCGRRLLEVDYQTIRAGRTATCSYYRCPQIAGMSPGQRVRFRPHRRASLPKELS